MEAPKGGLNRRMSQEPFGDIPLFREIQRLLSSSSGPINDEIARQVAAAMTAHAGPDATPDPGTNRSLSESVHRAQGLLSGYTRVALPESLQATAVSRHWWVTSTLVAWRWLLERLANRFSTEMGGIGGEGEEGNPLQAVMGQIAPLLMGIQVGTLVGNLAPKVLSRYDLPIPRDDDAGLFVVEPNVRALASDYAVRPDDVVAWIAIHDVAVALVERTSEWVSRYFRSLMMELVDSLEVDRDALERRLMELQTQSMESLQEGMGAEGALPIVSSPRHTAARSRLQAFVALLGGYAHHSSRQVAPEIVSDAARIDEVMARRAASPNDSEILLSTILGLSFDRSLESAGATFCAAVTSLRGVQALNRVWEAPDNLPDLTEIKDPFVWIERVLGSE
jgi:putative hydrolase